MTLRIQSLPLTACIALALAASVQAAPPKDLVKLKLLADVTAVRPGATFNVGVLLEITPGWHVYWTNPGDAGLPTVVKFQLPAGLSAGPLQYPTPSRFPGPQDNVMYGYGESVLLVSTIKAPADLKDAKDVKVVANASWLVCRDVCIPGKQKLELTLPVAADAAKANDDLFRKWSAAVPAEAVDSPDIKHLEWKTDPAKHEAMLVVTWKGKGEVQDAALFPQPDDTLDVRSVNNTTVNGQTTLTVSVRVLAGQKADTTQLAAVFGYTRDGARRGVRTTIPIAAALTPAADSK